MLYVQWNAVRMCLLVIIGGEGTPISLSMPLFFFFAVVFVCADVFVFVFVFLQVRICLLVMRDPPHPPLAASSGSSDATHPPRSRMVQKGKKDKYQHSEAAKLGKVGLLPTRGIRVAQPPNLRVFLSCILFWILRDF